MQSDARVVQSVVDQFHLKTGAYPVEKQPVLGNPSQVDFNQLENYLQRIPDTASNHYWWIDYKGNVYVSSIDAPSGDAWSLAGGVFNLEGDMPERLDLYEKVDQLAFTTPVFALSTTKPLAEKDSNLRLVKKGVENGEDLSGLIGESPNESQYLVVTMDSKGFFTPAVGKQYEGIDPLKPGENSGETEPEKSEPFRDPVEGEIPIYTAEGLARVGTGEEYDGRIWSLDANYILMSDINLSDCDNWDPIGNDSNDFGGTFDGNGLVISNLTINHPDADYQGLFGQTTAVAKIINVALEDLYVTGGNYTGGLVGRNKGTITNCYAVGSVNGDDHTGGLVGQNYKGGITNSYATGYVTGSGKYTGGLVGNNYNGTIASCYSLGNVTGCGNYTGGLVGNNISGSTITDSYSTGNVTGCGYFTGGLVGRNDSSAITSSYATGGVDGNDEYTGGLVGYNSSSSPISSSYATGGVDGGNTTGGLVGYNSGSIVCSYSASNVTGNGERIGGLVGYNTNTIEFSYSIGNVTGDGENTGGLVGYNTGAVTNSYWDKKPAT